MWKSNGFLKLFFYNQVYETIGHNQHKLTGELFERVFRVPATVKHSGCGSPIGGPTPTFQCCYKNLEL